MLRQFRAPSGARRASIVSRSPSGVPFHPLVRSLDIRLRVNRLLRDAAWFGAALALSLLIPRLGGEGAPLVTVGVAVLGTAFLGWRFATGGSLSGAAGAGDRGGGLPDEFGSAQWFFSQPRQTAWETHQIARARSIADRLAPGALVPVAAPRATLGAVLSCALLALALPFFDGPLISESLRARLASGLAGDPGETLAGGLVPEETAEDARIEARSPEEVLEALRAGEMRMPEAAPEDEAAMEAALARAMEEQAFGASSEEVTAALAGLAGSLENAEALEEAMMGATTAEELRALLESLEAEGPLAEAMAELAEMLEAGMDPDAALQQLAEALQTEALQAMDGQAMDGQAPGAGGESQQQTPFPGEGEGGGQPQAGEGGGEPAGGMPQGAAGLSGSVQMAAAEGQMGAPLPMDAGPAGNMTGPGGGGESEVFGDATSLEVQLEMEAIPPPEDVEPVPEQIVERQSRREDATVDFDSVSALDAYADETVSRKRAIPAGLRPLVRAYFLMIRETVPEGAEEP